MFTLEFADGDRSNTPEIKLDLQNYLVSEDKPITFDKLGMDLNFGCP